MLKNHIDVFKDSYYKKSVGPDGVTAQTLAGYMKLTTDSNVDMCTGKDLVLIDGDNELVHCVFVNDDHYTQEKYPVKMISTSFEHIHAVEAVFTRNNFELLMSEGFLKDLVDGPKKAFITDWLDRLNIQVNKPIQYAGYGAGGNSDAPGATVSAEKFQEKIGDITADINSINAKLLITNDATPSQLDTTVIDETVAQVAETNKVTNSQFNTVVEVLQGGVNDINSNLLT